LKEFIINKYESERPDSSLNLSSYSLYNQIIIIILRDNDI